MKRYILKRLVTAFLIVMVVIVLNFTIIKLAPGVLCGSWRAMIRLRKRSWRP